MCSRVPIYGGVITDHIRYRSCDQLTSAWRSDIPLSIGASDVTVLYDAGFLNPYIIMHDVLYILHFIKIVCLHLCNVLQAIKFHNVAYLQEMCTSFYLHMCLQQILNITS